MKRFLALFLLVSLTACQGDNSESTVTSQDDKLESTVNVYIATGEKVCSGGGLTLTEHQSYLTDAGIKVNKSDCGVFSTTLANIPRCGESTYDVHIYNILLDDLSEAENIGFTKVRSITTEIGVSGQMRLNACEDL